MLTSSAISILIADNLPLINFSADKPNIYENTVIKHLGTPGSDTELIFTLKST